MKRFILFLLLLLPMIVMAAGNVAGPAGAVIDNRITRWDGVTGKFVQGSSNSVTDAGQVLSPNGTAVAPSYSFLLNPGTGTYFDPVLGGFAFAYGGGGGDAAWFIDDTSGDFLPSTASTYDIGRIGGEVRTIVVNSLVTRTNIALGTNANAPQIFWGSGDPNGVMTKPKGSLFVQTNAADGSAHWWVKTSPSSNLGWTNFLINAAIGSGDVTAAANMTDNALVRGDGGAKGVQHSERV